MVRRLKVKLKVFWSFYQIATKVGETYLVTYPRSVQQSLEIFSFVNLVAPTHKARDPSACRDPADVATDAASPPTLRRSWTGSGCRSRARGSAASKASCSS